MIELNNPDSIYSFQPIIDERSEILILGTIPGPESLRRRQYYANPNNQFWSIIYGVFEKTVMETAYEAKVSFLLEHNIALWDVFYSARRNGALDSDIENTEPNDISGLIRAYPRIKRLILGGRTAEKAYHKHFSDIAINAYYVPSASSAFAKKSIEEKIADWKKAVFGAPPEQ